MRRLGSKSIAFAAGLALFSAGTVLAADETSTPNAPARMEMTYDGPLLVTPAGMTLYSHSSENTASEKFKWQCLRDSRQTQGEGQQSGAGERPVMGAQFQKSCTQKFPPYLADANAQPVGDFSIINRPEGGKQWVYHGYPLYTSVKDRGPGDHNGAAPGGFGGGRNGAMRFAMAPVDMPSGLKFAHQEEGLILATAANDRPVYTPHGVRISKVCAGCGDEDTFQPILAPAVASVSGDWSIIDAGAGRRQYAFRGKPLYAAPASITDWDIADAGGWEKVVFQKSVGRPSEIGKHITLLGDVYTNKAGLTLYNYGCATGRVDAVSCDDAGDAATYMVALCGVAEECAKRWHPYLAPANARPVGEWSIVDITYPMFTDPHGALYPPDAPHVKVWAYRGKPLYTYYDDKKPGDIWGHGTKGLWGSNFNAVQVPGRSAL